MHIRWTDAAVHDFTHICDYIEEHGSAAAAARRVAFPSIARSICSEDSRNTAGQVVSLTRAS
jgi:plasmid stabilization system protein ParE